MEVQMSDSVNITFTSKRYNCSIRIKEKLTFVQGDSGVGKSEFVRRVESGSGDLTVSNGFDVVVMTKTVFDTVYKKAMDMKKKEDPDNKQQRTKFLRRYWSGENFPFSSNNIFIIDDEDFVTTHEFSVLFRCDKSNYYVIIGREEIPSLSYSVGEVYTWVADGKNHTISKLFPEGKVLNPTSFDGIV